MTITTTQLGNRAYQLEELEDSASCVSAIYLKNDGSLKLGRTDGPRPSSVKGSWEYVEPEQELRIDLTRYYDGDTGDYSYDVTRYFIGHLDTKKNSELAIFAGKIFRERTDFSPNEAVGFFEMIVANDDLPTESFDITEKND